MIGVDVTQLSVFKTRAGDEDPSQRGMMVRCGPVLQGHSRCQDSIELFSFITRGQPQSFIRNIWKFNLKYFGTKNKG